MGVSYTPPARGGGGTPAVGLFTGTADTAAIALSDPMTFTLDVQSGGFTIVDGTKLTPPENGLYRLDLMAAQNGSFDAPPAILVSPVTTWNFGLEMPVAPASGPWTYNLSTPVLIDDSNPFVEITPTYSDEEPTAGSLDVKVVLSRIGDAPTLTI